MAKKPTKKHANPEADKMTIGGQGVGAPAEASSVEAAPAVASLTPSPAEVSPARQVAILEDQGHLRADMRMMRAMLRNPCYVPNEFFEGAATKLMTIANAGGMDERVVVGAIKTVADIAKLNLKVNEVAAPPNPATNNQAVQVKVIINMPPEKPQPKVVEAVESGVAP